MGFVASGPKSSSPDLPPPWQVEPRPDTSRVPSRATAEPPRLRMPAKFSKAPLTKMSYQPSKFSDGTVTCP